MTRHGTRYGIVVDELVVGEQGVEYRLRDHVLGEHLHRVVFGHGIVDVLPERRQIFFKELLCPAVLLRSQVVNPGDVFLRDDADILLSCIRKIDRMIC